MWIDICLPEIFIAQILPLVYFDVQPLNLMFSMDYRKVISSVSI